MFTRDFPVLLVVLMAAAPFVRCEKDLIQEPTSPNTPASTTDVGNQQINERGFKILDAIGCGEIRSSKLLLSNKTELNEFPFIALLKYNTTYVYECGGTLITNRFILTVAHCWMGRRESPIAVRLGEHDYSADQDCEKRGTETFCNPPVEDYGIDKLIPHPLYRLRKIDHNIGLIRLDRDVSFKIHIHPICLPIHEDSQLADTQRYNLAGWAIRQNIKNGLNGSTILLKAIIPHRPKEFCQEIFRRYTITDDHICAGGESSVGSCIDESGGPLFVESKYNKTPKYVQYGIAAYGVISCPTTYPSLFVKIISHLPWLTNAIAENE